MPVQIDMEMPRSCEACDCLYRHRDMTTGFCPFTGHFVNFGDGREVDCPLVEAKEQKWHVVAEGDLPPKLKDGERAKTYLITKQNGRNDTRKSIDFAFWNGEAFGRERKCNIGVSGVFAWRELPEPWKGAEE